MWAATFAVPRMGPRRDTAGVLETGSYDPHFLVLIVRGGRKHQWCSRIWIGMGTST